MSEENEREAWSLVDKLLERNQYLTDKIIELALAFRSPNAVQRQEQLEQIMQMMMLKTINDKMGDSNLEKQKSDLHVVD